MLVYVSLSTLPSLRKAWKWEPRHLKIADKRKSKIRQSHRFWETCLPVFQLIGLIVLELEIPAGHRAGKWRAQGDTAGHPTLLRAAHNPSQATKLYAASKAFLTTATSSWKPRIPQAGAQAWSRSWPVPSRVSVQRNPPIAASLRNSLKISRTAWILSSDGLRELVPARPAPPEWKIRATGALQSWSARPRAEFHSSKSQRDPSNTAEVQA